MLVPRQAKSRTALLMRTTQRQTHVTSVKSSAATARAHPKRPRAPTLEAPAGCKARGTGTQERRWAGQPERFNSALVGAVATSISGRSALQQCERLT